MKWYVENWKIDEDNHPVTKIQDWLLENYKDFEIPLENLDSGQVDAVVFVHTVVGQSGRYWAEFAVKNARCEVIFCSSEPLDLVDSLKSLDISVGENIRVMEVHPLIFLQKRIEEFSRLAFHENIADYSSLRLEESSPNNLMACQLLMTAGTKEQVDKFVRENRLGVIRDMKKINGDQDIRFSYECEVTLDLVNAALKPYLRGSGVSS